MAQSPTSRPAGRSDSTGARHAAGHGAGPVSSIRPAHLILAQDEAGRIIGAVTTEPSTWKDERNRLEQVVFGRYRAFIFPAGVAAAQSALAALGREVVAQFGPGRVIADSLNAKLFIAEWPLLLTIFGAQNRLKLTALEAA